MSLIRKSFSEPSVTTGDSRVTSIDLDWSTSAVLSRVQEASGPSQERITQVLLGPKYSAVVWKLLDTGKSVEVQTLKLAFDNALNQVLERNTEFAAFHLEENAKKASNPSDKTAAREAGQVALKRFLNKDSLRRLNETPLEEWSTSDIRYARTLIAFWIAAKYGELGAFNALDNKRLLETLLKLLRHPRVNKFQELVYEAERQKMIQESQAQGTYTPAKTWPWELYTPPTVRELLVMTRKAVVQKIWNFFTWKPKVNNVSTSKDTSRKSQSRSNSTQQQRIWRGTPSSTSSRLPQPRLK